MNTSNNDVTLLLVEDDDIDAMSIERSLRKKKIANPVVRAYDGEEAFRILKSGDIEPFIVLLDLQLPRMNGFEFLDKIRADEKLNKSVVFVLTTSKSEADILESYRHSVAGYFVKDEVGESFVNVISMLESYWKIVHLPGES